MLNDNWANTEKNKRLKGKNLIIFSQKKRKIKLYLRDHVDAAHYYSTLNLDDGAQGFKLLGYLHKKGLKSY